MVQETTDNKYYTPTLEDLRVGYECEERIFDFSSFFDIFLPEGATQEEYDKAWDEVYNSDKFEFKKCIVDSVHMIKIMKMNDMHRDIHKETNSVRGHYRTLYLTKEQIEGEGWEYWKEGPSAEGPSFVKDFYTCQTLVPNSVNAENANIRSDANLWIYKGNYTLFLGNCPSINEFRTICKLLGI